MTDRDLRVHHVGLTVSDLDRALEFWQAFLGVSARWRAVLERPYLGKLVGYPGVSIDAAAVELADGQLLELLEYRLDDRGAGDEASARPGHMHLCLTVDDVDSAWTRAVSCGARSLAPDGPVDVDGGPNRGARVSYLRVPPDWGTLELLQPAHEAGAGGVTD
jgi:catechol 2,3-dioxygenase-like lactoylglutathione lyase family enzyme